MNVKMLNSGEVCTVNASYGMRLIEHGKAVLAPESENPPKKVTKKDA